MIGIQDAFDRLLDTTDPVPAEDVPLADLPGRVAARDLVADAPVPAFRRAMMDGYAVRVGDVEDASPADPVPLRVTGEVTAGRSPDGGPGPGEAWEITTGSPLPDPADGVVPYEWTRRGGPGDSGAGDRIEVRRPL
ncbi:MAG: molybdopterin molybdenumtransferase MoeA, partial [Gemmatimonadota bacterium]